ncbi:MAG: chemotaxis protein CheA, partial [Planctomycetota bacterium]|nr:chemotaxis protein CheA [Planctomycetota bacterium]
SRILPREAAPSVQTTPTPHRSGSTARLVSSTKTSIKPAAIGAGEFAGRYVSEASEMLEQIEQALLQAEQHPESSVEFVQEALRLLHSFKGNSGLMGLTDLERLSHRMETEVEKNSSKALGLDSQVFDVLLQMIDILRQGVLDFSCGGSGSIPETDAYIAMMDEFGGDKTSSGDTAAVSGAAPADPPAPAASVPGAAREKAASSTDVFAPAKPPAAEPAAPAPPAPISAVPAMAGNPLSPPPVSPATAPRADSAARAPAAAEMLKGKPSVQEDLGAVERVGTIVITPVGKPPAQPGKPAAAAAKPGRPDAVADPRVKTTIIQPGGKNATQSQRGGDQVAGRNDIRVDLRKLDGMLDLVGELVIAEAMVTRHPAVANAENESLDRAVHQLRRVTNTLQDIATSVRMIPLAPTFRRMTRLVYDLSVKAGKQVDLILLGEDTEVDRTVIERISDPLVHVIRNAIDHGLETPADRVAAGKPETGRLTIEGHHEGGEVWIVITDDGRGLNREAILAKAISRGMISGDGADMNDNQIFHFIFEPGFSTAAKVTDISGRGFGMDVVKKNIEKLSGRIDIRTRPGEGTAVVMRIPLTLAIIDGMLVRAGGTRYIIPLLSIRESLRPDMSQIFSTPDGQRMLKIRDDLLPIVKLDDIFSRVHNMRDMADGILMIVEGEEGDMVALFADELLGQQETVIKGLTSWLKRSRGVSGCTILGDGEVGLILDIGSIVNLARQTFSA